MPTALIVVDLQRDFAEGGSLPVNGGLVLAQELYNHLVEERDYYELIIATKDWHRNPGEHFSSKPDYINSWPIHCVADSPGAEFIAPFKVEDFDVVVYKGMEAAAYSGFEGSGEYDGHYVDLNQILIHNEITAVDVVGLATDFCVKATAIDAAKLGFSVNVPLRFCRGVSPVSTQAALDELRNYDIHVVS